MKINIPHVFFEIAHEVILQLNIDVCRQPARPPPPLLKETVYATFPSQNFT